MTILDSIVEHKRVEVLKRKRKWSTLDLEGFDLFAREPLRICPDQYERKPGIIAEFKRRSPSKGIFNINADPAEISKGYARAGVAGMSILTDRDFFGGSFRDLKSVKETNPGLCLLRKDFIIDPYQVYESKAYGSDMILLIAAILSKEEVRDLSQLAANVGLQVLLEVHNLEEIDKFADNIELVGVNNRDLKDFSVDLNRSLDLIDHLPDNIIPVSESGINGQSDIHLLYKRGFRLFLIGEAFMKEPDPANACKSFIQSL